ncbi:MAG: COP23 domain-containing protein [Nostoc sp.]|uniref:COP23 domain-containing protein n=1 Tax=Nostoc sp. TaxID=1180 RepID=UPI002FFA3480
MSNNKNIFDGLNLTIGFISAVAGVAGLALAYLVATGWTPETPGFGSKDRFSCALQPDTQNGGEVWTVMYRNDRGKKPWLRMVNSFGNDWDTQKRCDVIAQRLENFRQDGLIGLSYRPDPKTPSQSVICVNTKLDRNNCNLLVTLKVSADGYESLRRMTEALKNGTTVEQGSGSASTSTVTAKPSEVNFENYLAAEDIKAGSTTIK